MPPTESRLGRFLPAGPSVHEVACPRLAENRSRSQMGTHSGTGGVGTLCLLQVGKKTLGITIDAEFLHSIEKGFVLDIQQRRGLSAIPMRRVQGNLDCFCLNCGLRLVRFLKSGPLAAC